MELLVTASEAKRGIKDQALAALRRFPPFSPILNRLIASLGLEEISFARIADLVENDAVLAGNVLGLVNSALFGVRGTVHSIRHAVALLGIDKLRNAMLSLSVARTWGKLKAPPGCSIRQFNLHSSGCAILSDLLARHLGLDQTEDAFAAGLFHDLGLLLIAIGLPDEFRAISLLCRDSGRPRTDCQREILGFTSGELAAEALELWNLPESILTSVRFQDAPDLDPQAGGGVTLSRVLNSAHRY